MNQKTTCPRCKQAFELPGELYNTTVACPSCNIRFNPMKEYLKAGVAATRTAEFQESFKADIIAPANQGISHAEFVTGVQNRTIGFKYPFGEPCELLSGMRKACFTALVILYRIAPFILVPLWAYHERNVWLLIGIGVSRVATRVAAFSLTWSKTMRNLVRDVLLIGCGSLFAFLGVHSYYAFFTSCALWGYAFFNMAEETQSQCAIQSLVESPKLFGEAIAQNKIMITRHHPPNYRR